MLEYVREAFELINDVPDARDVVLTRPSQRTNAQSSLRDVVSNFRSYAQALKVLGYFRWVPSGTKTIVARRTSVWSVAEWHAWESLGFAEPRSQQPTAEGEWCEPGASAPRLIKQLAVSFYWVVRRLIIVTWLPWGV
jgi:hypothetical protein